MGLLINTFNAFIITRFSTCGIARFIIDSKDNKGTGFGTGYMSSTAIACGIVSLTTFAFAILIPITMNAYDYTPNAKGFTKVSRILFGYAVGSKKILIKKIINIYYLHYYRSSIFFKKKYYLSIIFKKNNNNNNIFNI